MTFLSPWALAGLSLLAPLVLLHLRRRRSPPRDVPSLLPWRDIGGEVPTGARNLGHPALPLLLLLQALALIVLVVALARPVSAPHASSQAHAVFVVDDSPWLAATSAGTPRDQALRRRLTELLRAAGDGTRVAIVGAAGEPRILYRGKASDASGAVARIKARPGAAQLATAVSLGADLRASATDRVTLLHAPEDAAPAVTGPRGAFAAQAFARPARDRGLEAPQARCGLGATTCEVFALVSSHGMPAGRVQVRALRDGRTAAVATVQLAGGTASAPVVFRAPAGARIELRLPGGDALAADDRAAVTVPGGTRSNVTIVGPSDRTAPLARAFAADPAVRVRTMVPAALRPADVREADLLVLAGWIPARGLPAARSILLVDPPRVPGGRVTGRLADGRLSGSDPATTLLDGVDLDALGLDSGAGRRVTLPTWMAPVAWSPEGPLLATGDDGVHRVALLAFDPASSYLPQTASFPILAANLVGWSAGAADPPGTTTLVALAGPGRADLSADPQPDGAGRRDAWAPWLLLAGLLILLAEWLYAVWPARGRRR